MSIHFHVLASGSSGNACLLDAGGFGVLIDCGLAARHLEPRLRALGLTWERIQAVLLTHEHSDHWKSSMVRQFAKLGVTVYCHPDHADAFAGMCRSFTTLRESGLVRHYEPGRRLELHAACTCVPIALDHDGLQTHGFRLEGVARRGEPWGVGYAADLGCWQPKLAQHFADVDVLAVEFNHDVAMQLASGRSPYLIRRVLGDHGHLSNEQGAALLAEVLRRSSPGRVKHLVQLHLSRDCNTAKLAQRAADRVLREHDAELAVHTTQQGRAGPSIAVGSRSAAKRRARTEALATFVQPMLPFGDR
jgi:phosphoribosyl 1,2-cyclic phosphodiesterase